MNDTPPTNDLAGDTAAKKIEELELKLAAAHKEALAAASGYIHACTIAGKALLLIDTSLRRGLHHSRPILVEQLSELRKQLTACTLMGDGKIQINTNVRLFDLVRYMRTELHEANLITDSEYHWLACDAEMANSPEGGSPSPRRLEDYDEAIAKIKAEARLRSGSESPAEESPAVD